MAFNRVIELKTGESGTTGLLINNNLRMNFEVFKTIEKSVNTATVNVYNLSSDTRDKIKTGHTLILKAGYNDEAIQSIFFGTISKVEHEPESTEVITRIEASDGTKSIREKFVSLSYEKDTPLNTIITDVLDVLSLPYNIITSIPSLKYPRTYSFIGLAIDSLKELLNYAELKYSIQNEEINIFADTDSLSSTGLLISPKTGLIDSPKPLTETKESTDMENVPKKYNTKSLLYPKLIPNSLVEIKSKNANGTFKINNVYFKGDNWEGDFIADMEVVANG